MLRNSTHSRNEEDVFGERAWLVASGLSILSQCRRRNALSSRPRGAPTKPALLPLPATTTSLISAKCWNMLDHLHRPCQACTLRPPVDRASGKKSGKRVRSSFFTLWRCFRNLCPNDEIQTDLLMLYIHRPSGSLIFFVLSVSFCYKTY